MGTGYGSEDEKKEIGKPVWVDGNLLKDYMNSDNLNTCVDNILQKVKVDLKSTNLKVIKYNPTGREKEKRRRHRKNDEQFDFLHDRFAKNPFWDKSEMKKLARQTGLKESQIYKWNWDQRKKYNMITKNEDEMEF